MTNFVLLATGITLVCLIVLIRPLIRSRNTLAFEREAQNIHFAQERLQELESQLKNATINATDYESLKLEIESTLARDIDLAGSQEEKEKPEQGSSNKPLIITLCVALPIAAILLYKLNGTPEALRDRAPAALPSAEEVDKLIADVEQSLAGQPDDIEGWTVLARTQMALGNYQKANDAYLKLLEVGGEDANVYAQLADVAALQAGGSIGDSSKNYIAKALALNPQQPQALWLAGLSAAQQGQPAEARKYWQQLLPLLEGAPKQQQELLAIIQQTVDAEIAVDSQAQPSPPIATVTPEVVGPSIRVRVTLSEELQAQTKPEETVFVFARAKDGPPAPLAVKPLLVADLPAELILSDADAMMAQFKLSLFEQIEVSARIAKSGNPIAQPGDFQSSIITTTNNNETLIELQISEIVQ